MITHLTSEDTGGLGALESANVVVAQENAERNGVAQRTAFFCSDSVTPTTDRGRRHLSRLRGRLDFLVANPPHSATFDGFDFRRMLLRDAQPLVRPGAIVLLQALSAYGPGRVEGLCSDPGSYEYGGIALRTEVVPLDYGGPAIQAHHEVYCRAEAKGAPPYEFLADASGTEVINAREARGRVSAGFSAYARWQVHSFRRLG